VIRSRISQITQIQICVWLTGPSCLGTPSETTQCTGRITMQIVISSLHTPSVPKLELALLKKPNQQPIDSQCFIHCIATATLPRRHIWHSECFCYTRQGKTTNTPEQQAFPKADVRRMSCQVPRPKAQPPWALGSKKNGTTFPHPVA
jgi:hypothetical protein